MRRVVIVKASLSKFLRRRQSACPRCRDQTYFLGETAALGVLRGMEIPWSAPKRGRQDEGQVHFRSGGNRCGGTTRGSRGRISLNVRPSGARAAPHARVRVVRVQARTPVRPRKEDLGPRRPWPGRALRAGVDPRTGARHTARARPRHTAARARPRHPAGTGHTAARAWARHTATPPRPSRSAS